MTVAESSIMELPSWLTGIASEQRGRAVKSRGPLTEQNPSLSRYRGRLPSTGGNGCGDPSVSNETSLNSASGVPAVDLLVVPAMLGCNLAVRNKKKTYT